MSTKQYLLESVQPVLHPLLLRAAVERPKDFHAWLARQLIASSESIVKDEKLKVKDEKLEVKDEKLEVKDEKLPTALRRNAFGLKINEMLRCVQTKKQPNLTAEDLQAISGWLDDEEDATSHIDSWLPTNPDRKDVFTALGFAAYLGETALVRLLLDRSSKAIDRPSATRGCTPLYNAAQNGHLDTVALL